MHASTLNHFDMAILMITILLVGFTILGAAAGCQLRMMWEQHLLNQIQRSHQYAVNNTNLYTTMESALKTIEESNAALNPPHPSDCNCAYCEIKYGGSRKRTLPATRPGTYKECPIYRAGGCVCKREGMTPCFQPAVADKETGEIFHPEYIKALSQKSKNLQSEVKDLRAELERRDREAASSYPKLPPAKPGESYVMEGLDGSAIIVRGPQVADQKTQKQMVVNTPGWDEATQTLMDS